MLAENKALRTQARRTRERAIGILPRRYRRRSLARRLVPLAARVRFECEVPVCSSTSTASPPAQTVLDRWGGSTQLWHRMLAQNGYIVMSFDNRGTPSPRGRGWRKSVFHKVGILAPKDQAAAVKEVLRDASLPRQGSRRHLGMERRGIDDLECDPQVS